MRERGARSFLENAVAKAEDAVLSELREDEELLAWAPGQTSPPEWWSIVPVLSTLQKMKTRWWYIALTNHRLVLLQLKTLAATKFAARVDLDLRSIRSIRMTKGVLFCGLSIESGGRRWLFKEMEKDQVEELLSAWRGVSRPARGPVSGKKVRT